MLAFNIAAVRPDLSNPAVDNLLQFLLDTEQLSGLRNDQQEIDFHFGKSSQSVNPGGIGNIAEDDVAIAGDWNGLGFDFVGVVRANQGLNASQFLLDTDRDADAEYQFLFGSPGDTPLVGNFDGKNGEDVAVINVAMINSSISQLRWQLSYAKAMPVQPFPINNTRLAPDADFFFGAVGDEPLTGDFDRDGRADLVVVRDTGATLEWYLTLASSMGSSYPTDGRVLEMPTIPSFVFSKSPVGLLHTPVTGDWDGDGADNFGVVIDGSPNTISQWQLRTPTGTIALNYGLAGDQYLTGNWPDIVWDAGGGVDRSWTNPLNWSKDRSPANRETVAIVQPLSDEINFDSGEFSGSLKSRNKINVTGGTLTLRNESAVDDLNVTAGTVIIDGTTRVDRLTVAGGTVSFQGAARASSIVVSSGSLLVSSPLNTTSLTINGGVVQANAALGSGVANDASVDIVVTGGTLRVGTYLGARSFEMTNGQLVLEYRDDGISNPLQSASPVLLRLSGGSVLSAAIPSNPRSPIPNYLLMNNIELSGSVQFGNEALLAEGNSSQAELNERERNSYLRLEGIISGPGVFRKTGRGSILATGDNTYDGLTIIEQGEMVVTTNRSFGSTASGTELRGGSIGSVPSTSPAIAVTEPLTINDPDSFLTLRFGTVWSGPVTIGPLGGSLRLEPSNGGRVNRVSQLNLQGNVAITILLSQDLSNTNIVGNVDWPISGIGNVILAAQDGLDLAFSNSTNTYIGSTTIAGTGTVSLTQAGSIPADSNVVLSTGARLLNRSGQGFRPRALTGQGAFDLGDQVLTLDVTDERTFSVALNGNGQVVKTGSGVLTMNGSNTFTGSFTVSQGTVVVASINAIPVTSLITLATDTTLQISNTSQTISDLNRDGTIELINGALFLEPLSSFVVAGRITGTGSVTKRNSGLVILAATNSYVGPTSIEAGILEVTANSAIPASSVTTISSGATLRITNSNQRLTSLSGLGTLDVGSGTLTLNNPTTIGTIRIGGGKLIANANLTTNQITISAAGGELTTNLPNTLPTDTVTITSNITLDGAAKLGGFGYLILNGTIAGSGSLEKIGTGSLLLGFSNTYSGTTTVTSGILIAQDQAALGATSAGTIVNGGILALGGDSIPLGFEVQEPISVTSAGRLDLLSNINVVAALTLAGNVLGDVGTAISGDISLTGEVIFTQRSSVAILRLLGAITDATGPHGIVFDSPSGGTVTLDNPLNSYRGATRVQAGALRVTASDVIPNTSGVTIASGAMLDLGDFNDTLFSITTAGAASVGSGTLSVLDDLVIASAGTLAITSGIIKLSGDFTNAGTFTPGTGTVDFNAASLSQNFDIGSSSVHNLLHSGSGTLQLQRDLTVSGTLSNPAGIIDLNNRTVTVAGAITNNSGAIIRSGTGTLRLSSSFSNQGTFEPGTGTLDFNAPSGLTQQFTLGNSPVNNLTHSGTGTLQLQDNLTVLGTLSNTVGILELGSNAVTVTGAVSNAQEATLRTAGTLRLVSDLLNEGTLIANMGTIELTAPSGSTQGLNLGSSSINNLNHSGLGIVQLASDLTVTGNLSNTGGTFELGARVANIAGSLSNETGATLRSGSSTIRIARDFSNVGNFIAGTGTLDFNGPSGLTQQLNAGSSSLNNLVHSGSGILQLQSGLIVAGAFANTTGTVELSNGTVTVTGPVSNAQGATLRSGSSTLRLANNFTNLGTFDAGTGTLEFNANAGRQSVDIGGGSLFNLNHSGAGTLVVSSDLQLANTLENSAGAIDIEGKQVSASRVTLAAGMIFDSQSTGSLIATTLLDLRGGGVSANLGGQGRLVKSTSSEVVLSGDISVSGLTTIEEGTLKLGESAAFERVTGLLISQLGTFDLNNHSVSANGVDGTGTVLLGRGRLTANISESSEFGGVIKGTGGLIKEGEGTLLLSGVNTYQGNTQVNQGSLVLSVANAISQTNEVSIASEGIFDIGSSQQAIRSVQGAGLINVSGGTLRIANGEQPVEFNGRIAGLGMISNDGAGMLSLTGSGEFSGTFDVRSGTLRANGQFANAAAVVHDGASLQGTGMLGDVIVASGGVLRPGNSPGRMTVNSLDLNAGSTLVFEIGGPIPGSQHDQISVTNHALLNGQIVVQLIDGYVPSAADIFDLILYSTRSGSHNIVLPNQNGTQFLREQFTTNALRLSVVSSAPPPHIIGGTNSKDPELICGIIKSPIDWQQFLSPRAKASGESMFLVSIDFDAAQDGNVVATDWFKQSIDYIPIDPASQDESATIEIVVDAIFAMESMADLSSITSDVQPYAAADLFRKSKDINDETDNQSKPKIIPIPYYGIAAGTAFVLGGLSLLISTLRKPQKKTRYSDSPAVANINPTDGDDAESLKPLREISVKKANVGAKGFTHD
ncbi:MAG: autotransporter-associated beta strand repeat-containing protein [Pirellulaceae bacterium]|nr:autotransporter-associated beta strand repeat-containing protein [Pirellulaceae bacterium]